MLKEYESRQSEVSEDGAVITRTSERLNSVNLFKYCTEAVNQVVKKVPLTFESVWVCAGAAPGLEAVVKENTLERTCARLRVLLGFHSSKKRAVDVSGHPWLLKLFEKLCPQFRQV